jgi:hypothetical protein
VKNRVEAFKDLSAKALPLRLSKDKYIDTVALNLFGEHLDYFKEMLGNYVSDDYLAEDPEYSKLHDFEEDLLVPVGKGGDDTKVCVVRQTIRVANFEKAVVGLCPQMYEGDIVAILFGCTMPVVLRPRGSQFEVIGALYSLELSVAEALEDESKGGRHERRLFTLI